MRTGTDQPKIANMDFDLYPSRVDEALICTLDLINGSQIRSFLICTPVLFKSQNTGPDQEK